MKKFTKLFLSLAAVSVVTAAVATSAMAAEKTLTASYALDEGGATGTVTITCASEDATKTLLILKPGSDRTAVKATDIIQIDQAANITTAKLPALSADNEADKGTYTVLMGGESGDIYVGSFSIGGEPVTVGDVDGNGRIITSDANAILWYGVDETRQANVGKTINLADGGTLQVGDVDANGRIITSDANAILWYGVDDTRQANVGTTVIGTIVDSAE